MGILPTMLESTDAIINEALSIPQAGGTYYTLIFVCVIFNNDTGRVHESGWKAPGAY